MNDHEYEPDPIRRWLRRQQEEGWKEVLFVVGTISAGILVTFLLYWSDYPL